MITTQWSPFFDGWIIAVAAACAVACTLPGCFLVLRRQSMLGDALSHAVLPGIAIGFLVTGSRANWIMFVGAIIAALVTVLLTQWLGKRARVDHGAAMGVVFTTLFALGVVLIVRGADSVELDPHIVLYGALELTPLDLISIGPVAVPRAFVVLAGVVVANLLVITLLFKEFRIAAFDPELAKSLGLKPELMHALLMGMTAVTTVAAFEAVGSIIVVAMLVVPASCARLLVGNLRGMLGLAMLFALATAIFGHLVAVELPHRFGFGSVPTAGAMATVAGLLLVAVVLANPRGGVLAILRARWAFHLRTTREDLLALAWRLEERGSPTTSHDLCGQLTAVRGLSTTLTAHCLRRLCRNGLLIEEDGSMRLTSEGRHQAGSLVRSHRLWEAWLAEAAGIAPDHVHESAMRLEHVTDQRMREQLAKEAGTPGVDPHGRPIPEVDDSGSKGGKAHMRKTKK